MNHIKFLFILFQSLFIMIGTLSGQRNLGIFDNHTDIGNCKKKGFATYNPDDQTYTIGGAGVYMWFDKDEFHYLWTTHQGDFILRAEVKLIGEGVDPHRKVGWIVKNNLDYNSQHVNATIHGYGLSSLQYRRIVGGETEEVLSFDWFPHVSPDQKWILFLSYPKEINSGAHPFYKHCLLRIIPYEGGQPHILAYIYGGQGTINVPSWSPDSRKISFVTNSKM